MSDELIDGGDELQSGFRPSRRKVLVAAAWTVPVVIVGSAAPALADSSAPVLVNRWGPFCKDNAGSNKSYKLKSRWTNTYGTSKTVTILSVKLNSTTYTSGFSPTSFVVPATSTTTEVLITLTSAQNLANATVTITYTVSGNPTTYTAGTGSDKATPKCNDD